MIEKIDFKGISLPIDLIVILAVALIVMVIVISLLFAVKLLWL